ncbi:MAG: hypothetical protein O2968_18150 [Acidobacteria bacterium]|nr:hypothetical protein [Acidobacteriota bacterium]
MRRLPVFFTPIALRIRFLVVSVIVLTLPVSGLAAVCDQIPAAEREVESLRDRVRTLRADLASKKRRFDNVRSWMPDAGAHERLTEAKAAYDAAKASVPALREQRQQIERQRIDTLQQKQELITEKARIETARDDVQTLQNQPEVQELQRKVSDNEAYVRSQLGASPTSAAEAKATAGRVADISHIIWLQADDLSIFAHHEFKSYQPPSYTGRDRSRLWTLEHDLARQVQAYGAAPVRSQLAAQAHAAIKLLVEQVRELRTEVASRLGALAADMGKLQSAIERTSGAPGSSGRPGYETGFLSDQARGRRVAELEPRIAALQEALDRLTLELEEKTRGIEEVGSLQQKLRDAERALQNVNREVRETDRRDLDDAQREFDQANALLSAALEQLPVASGQVTHLRRLLNDKMAEISTVIAEAKAMPHQRTAPLEVALDSAAVEQCRLLRSSHVSALGQARARYEEEGSCLSVALPGIPAEIDGLIASIGAIDCHTDPSSRSLSGVTSPGSDREPSPHAGPCGAEPPEGYTYVPALANTGMAGAQAIVAVRLAGLRGHVSETSLAASPEQATRKVTSQSPQPCAVVPVGTTVEIAYDTNSLPATAAASASPQPVCGGCMVSEGSYGTGLVYLFESLHALRNESCANGEVRFYELYTFDPDKDGQGRPLNRSTQAERYAQAKATTTGAIVSTLCGPCSSPRQARAIMQERCPSTNPNISSEPGRVVIKGRTAP